MMWTCHFGSRLQITQGLHRILRIRQAIVLEAKGHGPWHHVLDVVHEAALRMKDINVLIYLLRISIRLPFRKTAANVENLVL